MNDHREMRLTSDPQVERWPVHPDLFVVSYELEGPRPLTRGEFEQSVTDLAREMGIQNVTVWPGKVILYGVRQGQEAAVHQAVVEAIRAENQRRRRSEEESDRARPER